FAVECTEKLIEYAIKEEEEETVQALLLLIISRTSDKVANVRSKALYIFVQVLQCAVKSESNTKLLNKISNAEKQEESKMDVNDVSDQIDSNLDIDGVIGKRIKDLSPLVRKAAIQVIEHLILLNPNMFLKPE